MTSVATGALPATEALGLMEQYLDVELQRRPLTVSEVGLGLAMDNDASVDEGHSPAPGRRRRTLFGGRRRGNTASGSPKASQSATAGDKQDDFYSAAAALDDGQRKAVMLSVANGSLSQSEALELVRQYIDANQPGNISGPPSPQPELDAACPPPAARTLSAESNTNLTLSWSSGIKRHSR